MPELGVRRESTVFVSGIGCAARFPYYMNTYGLHSIHGRAPAIATGLAVTRPDLDVWVIGGDGDMLSIGGNHLIHALRRNVNLTILMFNNRIYGLTKGQYSPTSEPGKVTKSTPLGSIDAPFNPISLALGAEATFVARTHDMDRAHMQETFRARARARRRGFVEVFQNCNVFNDGDLRGADDARPARRHADLARRTASRSASAPSSSEACSSVPTAASSSSTSPRWARGPSWCTTRRREDPGVAFALSRLGDSTHSADPDRGLPRRHPSRAWRSDVRTDRGRPGVQGPRRPGRALPLERHLDDWLTPPRP